MATTIKVNQWMDGYKGQATHIKRWILQVASIVGSAMAAESKRGPSQCIGKVPLKKELFFTRLIMALGLVCLAIVFRTSRALHFAPTKSAPELWTVGWYALLNTMHFNYVLFFKQDPWYPIFSFVDAFNATHYNNVTSSHYWLVHAGMEWFWW